jgi:hypothetical protein
MLDVISAKKFLKNFIDESSLPDTSLLEFLLSSMQSPDESKESKEDLLFSLLPEIGLLTDDMKEVVVITLSGDESNQTVFGFASAPTPTPNPTPTHDPPPIEDENEPTKVELQTKLLTFPGMVVIAEALDSAIVGFLLTSFKEDPSMDIDDKVELVKSYILQDIDINIEGDTDDAADNDNDTDSGTDVIKTIIDFFDAKALAIRDEESAKSIVTNQDRASTIQNSIQSVISNQRIVKEALTDEEAKERTKLVQIYGEHEVKPKYDKNGKSTNTSSTPILFVKNNKLESKIRYRDGIVATHAGGKYVTEKTEEYDSGLRGRVKSKGKRGAGAGKGL